MAKKKRKSSQAIKRSYERAGYAANNSGSIHGQVWKAYWGKTPKGFDVHHIDGTKTNNDITNLIALPTKTHQRVHTKARATGKLPDRAELVTLYESDLKCLRGLFDDIVEAKRHLSDLCATVRMRYGVEFTDNNDKWLFDMPDCIAEIGAPRRALPVMPEPVPVPAASPPAAPVTRLRKKEHAS